MPKTYSFLHSEITVFNFDKHLQHMKNDLNSNSETFAFDFGQDL